MIEENRSRFRPVKKESRRRLHPLSGIAILVLDNLFFGLNALTAGFGLPISMALAFWSTFGVVFLVQRFIGGESRRSSFFKGLGSAVIAGLPFSIGGTILGGWVLLNAGLSSRRRIS